MREEELKMRTELMSKWDLICEVDNMILWSMKSITSGVLYRSQDPKENLEMRLTQAAEIDVLLNLLQHVISNIEEAEYYGDLRNMFYRMRSRLVNEAFEGEVWYDLI